MVGGFGCVFYALAQHSFAQSSDSSKPDPRQIYKIVLQNP